MRIAGIDPGISGAATLLTSGGRSSNFPSLICVDIPTTGCKADKDLDIDFRAFRDLLRDWNPDFLYFENVHAFVGQGVVAAGRFMRYVGILEGICACEVDECRFVTPKKWKERFGLLHTDKHAARNMVMGLFPREAHYFQRVMDHNRADSALIAIYGAERCGMLDLRPVNRAA
jgi:hypothetical protein